MANLVIYGSGYSRPYMTDAAEVGSATVGRQLVSLFGGFSGDRNEVRDGVWSVLAGRYD